MTNGWWCCCEGGCVQYVDDFTRNREFWITYGTLKNNKYISPYIGSRWDDDESDEGGDDGQIIWDLASGDMFLRLNDDPVFFKQSLPDPNGSFIVIFDAYKVQWGDIFKVKVYWEGKDEDVSLTATMEADINTRKWIISLSDSDGESFSDDQSIGHCGTNQMAFNTDNVNQNQTFAVVYDRTIFRVLTSPTISADYHYDLWNCYDYPENAVTKIAFQKDGSNDYVQIDNVQIMDHRIHDATCPFYGCSCYWET